MNKGLILFLCLIGISSVLTAGSLLYNEYQEARWNDYARDFCSEYIYYNLTDKHLGTYYLIKNHVIEENWMPSYLECCKQLNMTCQEADTGILVDINKSGDVRLLNFNVSDDFAETTYFEYQFYYNENESLWEWRRV